MFPADRYDAVWNAPRPQGEDALPAIGAIPIGDPAATLRVGLWVSPEGRLLTDWPGLPGTAGARVDLAQGGDGPPTVIDTMDPVLRGFTHRIPLRRLAAERFQARCMVLFGLVEDEASDLIACTEHGQGAAALSCAHLLETTQATDAVLVYGVDGDYPDLLCEACLAAYTSGDVTVCVEVCSHCQQRNVYRHEIVATTWYGAGE